MKKSSLLTILLFLFMLPALSQEMGYKTVDVGGEFLWYPKGYISSLHIAYNARVHHAALLRIGYNKSNWMEKGKHDNEEGGGPGFSLGYRYYFLVRPHGLFIGVNAGLWRLTINWKEGVLTGKTKLWAIQPGVEIGYMVLVNDMFFISPSFGAALQSNLSTNGQEVGNGSLILAGISAGWKF